MGPIVRPNPVVNLPPRQSTVHEDPRRSYHESFFVKNSPVTGNEQVTAWLGVQQTSTETNQLSEYTEKRSSIDGHEFDSSGKQKKSILKRSPSMESTSNKSKPPVQKPNPTHVRTVGEKTKVKDSLEVINAKLFKELDSQVGQHGFSSPIPRRIVFSIEKNRSLCSRFFE